MILIAGTVLALCAHEAGSSLRLLQRRSSSRPFAHGLVDVYWVRVTPVLGWLLVGMVCGLYAIERNRRDDRPVVTTRASHVVVAYHGADDLDRLPRRSSG